jgi:hypothetical protein
MELCFKDRIPRLEGSKEIFQPAKRNSGRMTPGRSALEIELGIHFQVIAINREF